MDRLGDTPFDRAVDPDRRPQLKMVLGLVHDLEDLRTQLDTLTGRGRQREERATDVGDRLVELADEIDGLAVACDLSDLDRAGSVVPAVVDGLGPPEILVNVAGNMFTTERAESEPLEALRQTMDLNLLAPFVLAQAVFPHMRAVGRGAIVNISSISGLVGIPGIPQASYAAS
nr:SDR family oxidoreductase [Micromonospora sp. DSM 115978]